MPQFIALDSVTPLAEMVGLSLAFMLLTLLVFALYGLLASSLRRWIVDSPRLLIGLRRSFAAAFVGLGVSLALSE